MQVGSQTFGHALPTYTRPRHRLTALGRWALNPEMPVSKSGWRDHLTERPQACGGKRSAKPSDGAHTPWVRPPTSPPNVLKNHDYKLLSLYLRRLFQYGLLHFGQTLGSPTVLSRGFHPWRQRLHLYPFCLSVTSPIIGILYSIVIHCQGLCKDYP
jgi:hypothetical protein